MNVRIIKRPPHAVQPKHGDTAIKAEGKRGLMGGGSLEGLARRAVRLDDPAHAGQGFDQTRKDFRGQTFQLARLGQTAGRQHKARPPCKGLSNAGRCPIPFHIFPVSEASPAHLCRFSVSGVFLLHEQ